jgi:hypothetical protein
LARHGAADGVPHQEGIELEAFLLVLQRPGEAQRVEGRKAASVAFRLLIPTAFGDVGGWSCKVVVSAERRWRKTVVLKVSPHIIKFLIPNRNLSPKCLS